MTLKNIFFVFILFLSITITAQVGIGNTDPKATLDISATNVATPGNTDGILIPRVDEFPATNPTAAQDGMLIFITGNGTPTKGFYYWNQTPSSWIPVGGDNDWIINTTTGNMYNTINNVGIGTAAPTSKLQVNGNSNLPTVQINNANSGHGLSVLTSGDINTNFGNLNGVTVASNVNANAIGASYNGYNSTISTGTYPINTNIRSFNSTIHNNANMLGKIYGYHSNILNSTASEEYGFNSDYNNSGNSKKVGFNSRISSSGSGNKYGVSSTIVNSGGNPEGTGDLYGIHSVITTTTDGTRNHYGVYSDAQSANAYAGYFIGRMSLGNTTSNRYIMPASDGTANQVLQTNGSGQISFVNATTPSDDWTTVGSSGINASNFIGTTNNYRLSFRTNNTEKLRLTTKGQLEIYNTGRSVFLGEGAGNTDDLSNNFNTFIGYQSGASTDVGFYNTALGYQSLINNTSGARNVSLGASTNFNNQTGTDNIAIGAGAIQSNVNTTSNIAIGYLTLANKTTGNSTVAIGHRAGVLDVISSGNVYIGHHAGAGLGNGPGENKTGNIFIGYEAGYDENGNNKLVIENSNSTTPLIYGEFDNNILRANGTLQVGNPALSGYAFPGTDGGINQVMKTDGSGNVTWQNANNMSLARIILSANQGITTTQTWTKVSFDTVDFDLNTDFDTTNDRFIAPRDGYYKINAVWKAFFNYNNSNASYGIAIYINGVSQRNTNYSFTGTGQNLIFRTVNSVVPLNATDYVEIYIYNYLQMTVDSIQASSYFEIEQIR